MISRRPGYARVSGVLLTVLGAVLAVRMVLTVGFVAQAIPGYAMAIAMLALGVVRIRGAQQALARRGTPT